MALTDIAIRNAKPTEKIQRLFDGSGLYIEISPKGGKWWRFRYYFAGKEKRISLGVYPEVSLKEARVSVDSARKLLRGGVDPSAARKEKKLSIIRKHEALFKLVALQWHSKHKRNWSDGHADRVLGRIESNVFPYVGDLPISDITPQLLLAAIRKIEERGALDTAHRTLQNCGQIFRFAVAAGLVSRDVTYDLRGALSPVKSKHHASIIEPNKVGSLLRAIDAYEGNEIVRAALKLSPLLFVRPGELRNAMWDELDLEIGEWRIPAEKMKMRVPHIVPLSRQAIEIFAQLHPVTSRRPSGLVFPSARGQGRPISENTINIALRAMGYSKNEMTAHGFRSTASTLLHERGWQSHLIERQLAHSEKNKTKASYNFAEYLPERRKMMQSWADYLESLKFGAEVVPFRRCA